MQYLVERETVLPSLKDDCHPGLAHFGNHHFHVRKKVVEKIVVKTLEPFCLVLYSQSKFPRWKNQSREMLNRYFIIFFQILMMRIRWGVENHKTKFPTKLICFRFINLIRKKNTTTSLKNKTCTSEKCNDSEDEKLQPKIIHQTIPSVMEQSLNNSSSDPFFFKHISQFNYFVFLLLLQWMKIQF